MEQIRILGIGWHEDDLTLGAVRVLRSGDRIILRTGRCGCAEWLKAEGIPFETLDKLFEECEDFDELIEQSAQAVMDAADDKPVVYCVSDLSDKTCVQLCREAQGSVQLMPGVCEGGSLFAFAGDDVRIVSAADADVFYPDVRVSTLVREIDSPMLAGDIKLRLSEHYPDELDIYIIDAAGRIQSVPLCELDRLEGYDHRMCALIPAVHELDRLERYDVRHLEEIMRRLRDYDGCPWDREQTHESLKRYLVEEAYEAADAIDRDDPDDLYDELGDVLLQVIFHADIARQYGEFELSDVTTAICRKMIRRHPHVFGHIRAEDADTVTDLWNDLKKQEKQLSTGADTMRAVAGSLPALMRAAKVVKRAVQHRGAYPDADAAWSEWKQNVSEQALGNLLLALSGKANQKEIEAELSLNKAIDRFISRFEQEEANRSTQQNP